MSWGGGGGSRCWNTDHQASLQVARGVRETCVSNTETVILLCFGWFGAKVFVILAATTTASTGPAAIFIRKFGLTTASRAAAPHRFPAHCRRRAESVPPVKLPATARPDLIPGADESNQRRSGGVPHLNADTHLGEVEAAIKDAVVVFHPGVDFTDIWVEPRTSWNGSDMIEVWAVYDGDTGDLAVPAKHSLRTRIQDILWDMGVDAFPNMHLVAKADAKDLKPETV